MFRVAIPARHASTRLPGKPLALLAGRPMIEHVYRLAMRSSAMEVVVVTDDERIRAACAAFGAAVEMSSEIHPSGTDRIAEIAVRRAWADDSVVVNVQADEPMLPPSLIDQAAAVLAADRHADFATLCTPITALAEYLDPNVVKVVMQSNARALYFSRAPVPWCRDGAATGLASQREFRGSFRHLGIYAYRVGALRRLAGSPPSQLERLEGLEQLRALEMGLGIAVAVAREAPGPGVDTPADLRSVEILMTGGANHE